MIPPRKKARRHYTGRLPLGLHFIFSWFELQLQLSPIFSVCQCILKNFYTLFPRVTTANVFKFSFVFPSLYTHTEGGGGRGRGRRRGRGRGRKRGWQILWRSLDVDSLLEHISFTNSPINYIIILKHTQSSEYSCIHAQYTLVSVPC